MKNTMFRREVVEKMTSPEDLNLYVKVLNPRIWMLLIGIIIAIAGLIIFTVSTGFPIWDLFFGNTRG